MRPLPKVPARSVG